MPEPVVAPETAQDPNRFNPYGPGANADETRQAQHGLLNDAILDVNMQQVMVRSQSLTVDIAGKDFATGHKRLDMLQERFIAGVKPPA